MNETKKEAERILIAVGLDIGASMSKACYTIQEGIKRRTDFMKMDSEIVKVPMGFIKDEVGNKCQAEPENSAWITYSAKSTEVTAVGNLAKKYNALKESQIRGLKYENAIDKCLSFVGAIVTKHGLVGKNTDVSINLLIPLDELKAHKNIESRLNKSIKRFYFQGKLIESKLINFNCYPEGVGGYYNRLEESKADGGWGENKTIAVIMLGHRNCSFLLFEKGIFKKGDTIMKGFFDFLTDIKNQSVGQQMSDLEAVVPKVKDIASSKRLLKSLIRGNKSKNQKFELGKIESAIATSREKFWCFLREWLDLSIPSQLNEIQIFGGAASFFQEELEQAYSWSDIYWGADAVEEIKSIAPEKFEGKKDNLAYRFVDVFGIHKYNCEIK